MWVHGPGHEPWEVYTVKEDSQDFGTHGIISTMPDDASAESARGLGVLRGHRVLLARRGSHRARGDRHRGQDRVRLRVRRVTTDHADRSAVARERVRARYATAAGQVRAGQTPSCSEADPAGMCGDAYDPAQLADTGGAGAASLGCGNPLAVAELVAGETVLDLGSGAGLDVLLSARRVGPDGFAYGLDMTDEMLDLARQHARRPAPPTSSSSRATSRPSRCPTPRSTSSSPTA